MKTCSVIYISLLVFFTYSCTNHQSKAYKTPGFPPQNLLDSNGNKKKFDSLLADICKDTVLDFNAEVIANPSFRVIYEHSSDYIENVIRFLSKSDFNSMQASVCIFAMQNLSAMDYVRLCRVYLRLYNHNTITEKMLEQAILPNFLGSDIIAKNYHHSEVIALLNEIKTNGRISSGFKQQIEDVLSGKYIKG